MPVVHVAIIRRVRAGSEAAFQHELREFLQASFDQEGVWGASMLAPPAGSNAREFGILRTFASEQERDAFYASPAFKAWELRARALTEGEPEHRPLHGLETWFRNPNGSPPPRWKMALATFAGVLPISMLLNLTLVPLMQPWPFVLRHAVFTACMVGLLTWVVMPQVTRLLRAWLIRPSANSPGKP